MDDLMQRIEKLLFRISSENVPLFGSNRLRDIHKECGEIISLLRKSDNNIYHPLYEKGFKAGMAWEAEHKLLQGKK